jgi:hypothetical protein
MFVLIADRLGPLTPPTTAFAPLAGTGVEAVGAPLAQFISNLLGFITGLAGIMFLIYLIFARLFMAVVPSSVHSR